MGFHTPSDGRIPVDASFRGSSEEFRRLGDSAERNAGKPTRRLKPDEMPIPRESKITFAIGAGVLFVCLSALVVKAIVNRPARSLPSAGTTAPAATVKPPAPPAPEDDSKGN